MLKFGIEINLKEKVLSGFKLLSYDSVSHIPYKIHMCMFPRAPTRDCIQGFETVNSFRISYGSLPQRGCKWQKAIFDVSHDYVRELSPTQKNFFSSKCNFFNIDIQ